LRGNEAKPMHKLRGLARLSIANNLLSDQFVCKLFDTLLEMGTIEALDLQSTGLSPEIVDEVDRFIVNYKNIALIDLRLNEFGKDILNPSASCTLILIILRCTSSSCTFQQPCGAATPSPKPYILHQATACSTCIKDAQESGHE